MYPWMYRRVRIKVECLADFEMINVFQQIMCGGILKVQTEHNILNYGPVCLTKSQ